MIGPLIGNKKRGNVTLTAREILEKRINKTADKYPPALKPKHLQQIMSHKMEGLASKTQVNNLLNSGHIPAAKKLPGLGWRIPRDVFLSWWFGRGSRARESTGETPARAE